METKEWPLRPEDIDVPIPQVDLPRYAFIVQIIAADNLWAPEKGQVVHPKVVEEVPKTHEIGLKTLLPVQDGLEDVSIEPVVVEKLFSKASVSFRFPGEPSSEIGPHISDPVAPEQLPPPPEPLPILTQDEEDELSDNELPLPLPSLDPPMTKFGWIACKEFEVRSNYTLWNKLLQEPMEIIIYWTSPSGAITKPLGRVMVDLFPALALNGEDDVLKITSKVQKILESSVVEEKAKKSKKDKEKVKEKEKTEKPEKEDKKSKKKKKDAYEEGPLEETLPELLEGAVLKFLVSTSTPFWSELNRLHGLVMEISIQAVHNLPPKVQEFGRRVGGKVEKSGKGEKVEKAYKGNKVEKVDKGNNVNKGDPFSYALVANIPGFIGTYWWKHIEGLLPEDRAPLEHIKLDNGRVEKEHIEFIIPEPKNEPESELELGSEEVERQTKVKVHRHLVNVHMEESEKLMLDFETVATKREETHMRKMELQNKLLCCEQSMKDEDEVHIFCEVKEKPQHIEPKTRERMVIKWPETQSPNVKRFIPGTAALELFDLVKVGSKFRGELARYLKPLTDLFDPNFEKYHGCFFLDLSGFLEEGVTSLDLEIPFEQFTLSGTDHGITFCESPPKPIGKKPPKVVEDDDPLPISVDPKNILPNTSWQVSNAVVLVHIHIDKPMMPIWEPPPQPNMTLEEVIPPRKKPHTVYDAIKLAKQDFSKFVTSAADDLINLYQETMNQDQGGSYDDHSLSPISSKRIETKGEIRKKMVKILQKSGTWSDMVEEMKVRVLKVATEKYREKRRATSNIGKFEFCNDLYISLTKIIYNTLKELMAKRRELKEVESVKDVDMLRSLADEYEVSEDWKNAYRCHQERLTGDNMKNADLWFEFGCLCMRVRPKDHGKAEECWREALALDKNHLLSLQALGCLLWHRGYLTQAEVLLRTAIDIHSLEEHISWVIISQIYAAQDKFDNERACLRRAEKIYYTAQNIPYYRTQYSPVHQLLSPLLEFPFSIGHLVRTTKKMNTFFVDAIMFLLDIHLPIEARMILELDSSIHSCTLENKWCRIRASELSGDLQAAENFSKEAHAIEKDHHVTWLLLGHLRYRCKPMFEVPLPLQASLWKGAVDAYAKYHRYIGIDQDMYQHVYLEMGMAYFKLKEYDQARKTFLKGCTIKPTCPSLWLATGVAYYFLGDMKHAELALVEGNVLDVQNFSIWAYLTLVCLQMGRDEEAENSFQQALKTNLDPELLASIAEHFCLAGNFRDAEIAFTESLKLKEMAIVRFNRAEMYFNTNKLFVAKKDYNIVVKLPDVTPLEQSKAISRLTELQDVKEPLPINRFPHSSNYEV